MGGSESKGRSPRTVELSAALQEIKDRWLELPRREQDELYAAEFAPAFIPHFAKLPLHGAPPDLGRARALVSVLGFSWQPVALMAAWVRPERMLVIGTQESLAVTVGGKGVLALVSELSGIDRDRIRVEEVGDPGEEDIYRAVRALLEQHEFAAREVFVDPTGGKKSMSASAALAGFLAGAPLAYVDYAKYDGPNRIPVAGSEYPRLLANPLEVFGDLELRDIFAAFNRSDFLVAKELAGKLAQRLYEPREAECLVKLSAAYAAWDRFDFAAALTELDGAADHLDRFSRAGGWAWAPAVHEAVQANKDALRDLVAAQQNRKPRAIGEGRALLAWYLAAARRLLDAEKPSLAVLLTYAAVERFVDLCLRVEFGLDDENPDYSLVEDGLDLDRYDEAGGRLFGKNYRRRELAGPLMFGNGAQLLAALRPELMRSEDLGELAGLSNARNKCEYEHGFVPVTPAPKRVEKYLEKAQSIVDRVFEGDLDDWIARLQFPRVPD